MPRKNLCAKNHLTVAQIGCGAFATLQDLPNFRQHPQVECKWCCDINESQARRLAETFGVPCVTTDFREVLADPEVDFIKLSTSHEAHLPLIEAAAHAGKHVFCEKPSRWTTPKPCLSFAPCVKAVSSCALISIGAVRPPCKICGKAGRTISARTRHQPWRYIETQREALPEEAQTQFLVRVQDESASYRLVHLDPLRGGGTDYRRIGALAGHRVLAVRAPGAHRNQGWGSARLSHGIHLTFSAGIRRPSS